LPRPNRTVGPKSDKRWREAITLAVLEPGERGVRKLRTIAEKVVELALGGEQWAVQEIGDRLDGKSHQSVAVRDETDASTMSEAQLMAIAVGEVLRGGEAADANAPGSGTIN